MLHVLTAYLLLLLSFVVARSTRVAEVPLLMVLFGSLPVLIVGALNLYFGSYSQIPEIVWVMVGMLFGVGVIFLLSMQLV